MGRLEGKVAIITGGASGMGAASVSLFCREGASIVVADINEESGEAAAAACRDAGGKAVFQRTDVTREDNIIAMVARAVSEFGGLNVLFNNAGSGGPIGLDTVTVDQWDASHALLLRSAFLGIKHAVPELRRSGGGSIINTSSDAGVRGLSYNHAYSSLKAGLVMLTQTTALDLGKYFIRVNAITPGWIITPLLAGTFSSEQVLRDISCKAQPIPRNGEGNDIAEAALFLASEASSFITGVTLPVDGGWLVQSWQNPAVEAAMGSIAGGVDWKA